MLGLGAIDKGPVHFLIHLLYANGALSDGVEGLRVVVVHEVGRVIVGLCATVVLG